jgi:hypothetical protein
VEREQNCSAQVKTRALEAFILHGTEGYIEIQLNLNNEFKPQA